MKYRWLLLSIALLCCSSKFYGQEMEPRELLGAASAKLTAIEAYTVDAVIEVDIDFVNMPVKTATISYEAPDKLDVRSEGMLLMPRIGLRPLLKRLDWDNYLALYLGEESIEDIPCHVLKLVPMKQKGKIILATAWIRKEDLLIARWEVFTKKTGRIQADLYYRDELLPAVMVFRFEVSGMNVPLKYFGGKMDVDTELLVDQEQLEGKITVNFRNYRITYLPEPDQINSD